MRQTAAEKFKRGDKVKPARRLLERRKMKYPDRHGTVAGFGSTWHPETLYVIPDGTHSWQSFHMDDWEKVEDEPSVIACKAGDVSPYKIGIQTRVHDADLAEHVREGAWEEMQLSSVGDDE